MAWSAEQGWMLLVFVAANFVLAGIGSRFGDRGHGTEVWFASLRKPSAYPQGWIFPRVWALVLVASGVGGWIIWQHTPAARAETALVLYGFQLLVHAAWQALTIGLRLLRAGLRMGYLLWAVITLTIVTAWALPGGAAYWLLPYWLWTGFGVLLNRRLCQLNPTPAGSATIPPAETSL